MGGHNHSREETHAPDNDDSHTHGVVDPTVLTTERGIWAVKWSLVGLMLTAVLQVVIVYISGSVALLADTIHNFGWNSKSARPRPFPCGSLSCWLAGSPANASPTARGG